MKKSWNIIIYDPKSANLCMLYRLEEAILLWISAKVCLEIKNEENKTLKAINARNESLLKMYSFLYFKID